MNHLITPGYGPVPLEVSIEVHMSKFYSRFVETFTGFYCGAA